MNFGLTRVSFPFSSIFFSALKIIVSFGLIKSANKNTKEIRAKIIITNGNGLLVFWNIFKPANAIPPEKAKLNTISTAAATKWNLINSNPTKNKNVEKIAKIVPAIIEKIKYPLLKGLQAEIKNPTEDIALKIIEILQ